MTPMQQFTVFGTVHDGHLHVAGVVRGRPPQVDDDPGDGRWSGAVLATDPADAEVQATVLVARTRPFPRWDYVAVLGVDEDGQRVAVGECGPFASALAAMRYAIAQLGREVGDVQGPLDSLDTDSGVVVGFTIDLLPVFPDGDPGDSRPLLRGNARERRN